MQDFSNKTACEQAAEAASVVQKELRVRRSLRPKELRPLRNIQKPLWVDLWVTLKLVGAG